MAGRTAIGLDIGTSVVRAAELSFGHSGMSLEKFGQLVLPDGAMRDGEVADETAVTYGIRQLWSATRFTHKKVLLGVANQRVIVRQTELSWMPREELRASLAFQVQDLLPMPVDQAVLDFFPLEEFHNDAQDRMLRGLLVAAARETVLANVRCAERAGLSVSGVDLTPFAVLRALGRQTGLEVQTEALIDVGARVTNVVVHTAGVPRFVRILLMGGQDVTDAVAASLAVPMNHAEGMKQQLALLGEGEELAAVSEAVTATSHDFVDEVRGSLDYYGASNPGAALDRIVLSGGGSRLEGLRDLLATATRLPVVEGDPLAPMRIGSTGLDEDQISFIKPLATVPVGLAMGAF